MSAAPDRTPREHASPLKPVISSRYALAPRHAVACGYFGLLFLLLSHLPLWHTDLWSHVAYGHWIWEHRQLPFEDPFMPLAEGMPVINSAWLSQVILAGVEAWGGAAWLSNLFAVVVLATYLVLARVFYLQSGNLWISLVGTTLALVVGSSRLATIRPEMFGLLCFSLLCWLVVGCGALDEPDRNRSTRRLAVLWWGVLGLFVLWANLHGSFACGIALVAALFVGRAIEVAWQQRCPLAVVKDRVARRLLLLAEVALLASLVNPHGLDLLIYTASFTGTANLRDVLEWQPLVILGIGGREFALSLVVLLAAWRHSRRPIRPYEVVLLATFALAAVAQIRMLAWYAPIFALVVMPHLADIAARLAPLRAVRSEPAPQAPPRLPGTAWRSTLCCALILWICFALSWLSQPLLGNAPRPVERLYSRQTPLGVTAYLRDNRPLGQIYNPQWWGDWLVWDGPADLRPFATTMLHLIPRTVWQHYQQIDRAQGGWGELLNRYAVTTVVVDRERQPLLGPALLGTDVWRLVYEDELAQVFERVDNRTSAEPGAS